MFIVFNPFCDVYIYISFRVLQSHFRGDESKNIFLFSEQQNLFPQNVCRAAKLGNICIRNNVSKFRQALTLRLYAH